MKSWQKYSLIGLAAFVLSSGLAVAVYVFFITRDLPSYDALAHYEPPVTTRVYAGNGTLIGEYARERRLFVPGPSIPDLVKHAFISAEDKNFYNHPGIDFFGIMRAAINNVSNVMEDRRLEGASTITQQVAKNFLLTSEVKFSRKVREAVLAMRIDHTFTKEQILELYLNEIFLGENSYGVAAAALNYFDKPLEELEPAEVAFLAALPKAPSNYSPTRQKAAAIERRNWVLDQMTGNGYLTRAEAAAAKEKDLVTFRRPFGAVAQDVDYFVEEVRRILYNKYGEQSLYDGGLQVRSTLDTRLQDVAVRALRKGLLAYDRRHGYRGPVAKLDVNGGWQDELKKIPNKSGVPTWRLAVVTAVADKQANIAFLDGSTGVMPLSELSWARPKAGQWMGPAVTKAANVVTTGDVIYVEAAPNAGAQAFGIRQIPAVNGAIVAIDPFTGQVMALSGGFSYGSSEFDRAMQAMRQPGSTFKPFVYAAALDNGYTPATKVLDAPFAIEQGPGLPLWSPQNYEAGQFLGSTTLRRGLELSRNVMTVRLAHDVGMEAVASLSERMGVYDKLPRFLSMSLGAGEVTLLRLTTGYAEFVNGGRKLEPTLINRIQDRHGKTVYRFDQRVCEQCNQAEWQGQEEPLLPENRPQVLDPRTAYQVVSMLQGVVQRGTGYVINSIGKPLAGKTGTSSDYRDTWFIGFSPDLAVGVFVGFDNPASLGHGEAGSATAAPIFKDFMAEALADKPATPFRVPEGVVLVSVNPRTGVPTAKDAPGSILEPFKPGTEPGTETADVSDVSVAPERAITSNPDTVKVQIGSGTGGLY